MTDPLNSRYRRRFPNPAERPSNMPFGCWASAETLNTLRELNEWWDAQNVVAGAEQLLRAEGARRERARRWEQSGLNGSPRPHREGRVVRRGDPGE